VRQASFRADPEEFVVVVDGRFESTLLTESTLFTIEYRTRFVNCGARRLYYYSVFQKYALCIFTSRNRGDILLRM